MGLFVAYEGVDLWVDGCGAILSYIRDDSPHGSSLCLRRVIFILNCLSDRLPCANTPRTCLGGR